MSGGQNMRSVWTENGENSGGGCRMGEYGNSKNGADREKISMRKPGRNRTAVLFLCAAVSVSLLFAGGCGRSVSPEDDAALLKEMNAAESADSSAETAESDDTGEAYRSPNLEEYNQAALDHMLQVEPKCVEVPGQRTEDRWTELEDISGIGAGSGALSDDFPGSGSVLADLPVSAGLLSAILGIGGTAVCRG